MSLDRSHRYQCDDISAASFRSYMREHARECEACHTLIQRELANAHGTIRKLIHRNPDLRGIFVNDGGIFDVLCAMRELLADRRRKTGFVCRDVGP